VTDSVISDCRIENIAPDAKYGSGVRLAWGSSRNRVLRNTIHNTGRGGIFADNGSTDVVIQGNTVTGSRGEGLGIEVWGGCDRAVIEDNRIDHWLSFGGCSYGAARRNVISDKSGTYKFCGIEAIGSYLVITDNVVDGGAKIGLSVSGKIKKDYVFWARNTVRACNQWGTQFQGESTGIAYHYLYKCKFLDMPIGRGSVWYPGVEGNGFRFNGQTRHVTFEECQFSRNHRLGIQFCGKGIDSLYFVRCAITGNKGAATSKLGKYSALEWIDCQVKGNGSDELPTAKPFPHPPPKAGFKVQSNPRVGRPVSFVCTATPAHGKIAAVLWDFGDGPPSTDKEAVHVYSKPGKYRVTQIVWDEFGRAARAEREVRVKP
jgi:parallel beta-helix repeat protein